LEEFEAQKELTAFYVDKLNKAEDALVLAQGEMMAAIDRAVAAELEIERLKADAERWRFYAGPQTALMLGSQLDLCDPSVDWLAECNRLADKIIGDKP
jgi:hypothetical protein